MGAMSAAGWIQGGLTVKAMREVHFAILRRHMVEVIGIQAELRARSSARRSSTTGCWRRWPGPAAPIRAGAARASRLPGHAAADRLRQDDLAAVHRRRDDRSPGPATDEMVLEVGTGLGYQTAVLAQLAGRVWSVEIVEEWRLAAETRLRQLGYTNVGIRIGDGSRGWAEHAPFDRIMVTAAAELVPPALIEQLKPGGRMVLPVGATDAQKLTVMDKDALGRVTRRQLMPVCFSGLETMR